MPQIRDEVSFTRGRIIVRGKLASRGQARSRVTERPSARASRRNPGDQRRELSAQGSQGAQRQQGQGTREQRKEANHAMKANYLPIVCMPLELSEEAAINVLIFLREMTAAFEEHYADQIARYNAALEEDRQTPRAEIDDADIPF
ncbi:MAG: hypothetical protein ACKVQT_16780 [Burkholderiales bacterium]